MIKRVAAVVIATLVVMLGLAGTASAQVAPPTLDQCPLLLEGKNNDRNCVRMMQEALNKTAPHFLTPDGNFGAGTRIAVLDFQGRNRLPADGNAGLITLRELHRQTASVAPPSVNDKVVVTDEEVCATQDQVPDGKGGCVARGTGEASAMGRPIGECLGEQAKKAYKDLLDIKKKRGIHGKGIEAGKKSIKRFKPLYELPKCTLWDTPK